MPVLAPKSSGDDALLDRAYRTLQRRLSKTIDSIVEALVRRGMGQAGEAVAGPVGPLYFDFADLTARCMAFVDLVARQEIITTARAARSFEDDPKPISEDDLPAYLKQPFVEAIREFAARDPVLARTADAVAQAYSRQRFAIARSTSVEFTTKVQQKLLVAQRAGTGMEETIKLFRKEGLGDAYAETVFRTNLATAVTAGRSAMARDPDLKGFLIGWRWLAVGDTDTRKNHMAMHGKRFRVDSRIWDVWGPPAGFQCYLPGTLVQGAFVAGSKAFYAGPSVTINTLRGNRLSVTANHPVLTGRGWIGAKDVREGDDLFGYCGDIDSLNRRAVGRLSVPLVLRRNVDNQDMPARIEDAFESIARKSMATAFSRCTPLDFHGDAAFFKGEIDIELTDGMLPFTNSSQGIESRRELCFQLGPSATHLPGHAGRELDSRRERLGFSSHGSPSGGALLSDDALVITTGLALRPFESLRIGPAARLNASVQKTATDSVSFDSEFFRASVLAHPGEIGFDKCVAINVDFYDGHVYDLQSVSGWMVAENIVTSNCRCARVEITRPEAEEKGWLDKDGNLKESEPPNALPDPGFRQSAVRRIYG